MYTADLSGNCFSDIAYTDLRRGPVCRMGSVLMSRSSSVIIIAIDSAKLRNGAGWKVRGLGAGRGTLGTWLYPRMRIY